MQRHPITLEATPLALALQRGRVGHVTSLAVDTTAMEAEQARALGQVHARKARIGKAITSTGKDRYQVTLVYENRSDQPRVNVRLEDFVPRGFSISTEQACERHERPEGALLAWTIDEVAAGESREVSFTVINDGTGGSLKHPGCKAFK